MKGSCPRGGVFRASPEPLRSPEMYKATLEVFPGVLATECCLGNAACTLGQNSRSARRRSAWAWCRQKTTLAPEALRCALEATDKLRTGRKEYQATTRPMRAAVDAGSPFPPEGWRATSTQSQSPYLEQHPPPGLCSLRRERREWR